MVPPGVGAHRVYRHHVNMVVKGTGGAGQIPDIKTPEQSRWPQDYLGALQGQFTGKLGEVAVVTDNHTYFTKLGIERLHFGTRCHPTAAVDIFCYKGVGLAVGAHHRPRIVDEGGGIVNCAVFASFIEGVTDMDPLFAGGPADFVGHPARNRVQQFIELVKGKVVNETGGDRFREHHQVGSVLLRRPVNPFLGLLQVVFHVIGPKAHLRTGHHKLFHAASSFISVYEAG
ncbi:MAG: hypothetical protein DDT21_02739 [Syntrophomonadaceae bacterium]|nr:hypothetical protein [Bacillota bacterium]